MKKIVALVLALALALTAVAAFAAGSPEGPGGKVTPGGGGTDVTIEPAAETLAAVAQDSAEIAAIKDALMAAANNGDVMSVVPEEIQEVLEKEELTVINEMVTVKFPAESKTRTFTVNFQTGYQPGDKVSILVAVPGKDGEIEWISVTGTVIAEGVISFTLDDAAFNKVAGKEALVIPASAK